MDTIHIIEFRMNKASEEEICNHLQSCDASFVPPLSTKVNLQQYADKIKQYATNFEAWNNQLLVGLVAAYSNDESHQTMFITNVSTLPEFQGKGVSKKLLHECKTYAVSHMFKKLRLQVHKNNVAALQLYSAFGFIIESIKEDHLFMDLTL